MCMERCFLSSSSYCSPLNVLSSMAFVIVVAAILFFSAIFTQSPILGMGTFLHWYNTILYYFFPFISRRFERRDYRVNRKKTASICSSCGAVCCAVISKFETQFVQIKCAYPCIRRSVVSERIKEMSKKRVIRRKRSNSAESSIYLKLTHTRVPSILSFAAIRQWNHTFYDKRTRMPISEMR